MPPSMTLGDAIEPSVWARVEIRRDASHRVSEKQKHTDFVLGRAGLAWVDMARASGYAARRWSGVRAGRAALRVASSGKRSPFAVSSGRRATGREAQRERERRRARAEWSWGGLAGGQRAATSHRIFFLGLVMLVTVFCRTAAVGGRAAGCSCCCWCGERSIGAACLAILVNPVDAVDSIEVG